MIVIGIRMSSLTTKERLQFEKLFRMEGGYVLGFSDDSFGNFFAEHNIPIHSEIYEKTVASKTRAPSILNQGGHVISLELQF